MIRRFVTAFRFCRREIPIKESCLPGAPPTLVYRRMPLRSALQIAWYEARHG